MMFEARTPHALFRTHAEHLDANLPGVFDASIDAIHDARVATRRLRELLPLLNHRLVGISRDEAERTLRRMGRSLGRVRDTDVRIALLSALERRIPRAAPILVVERQRHEHRRLRRTRKLIKRFEQVGATEFVGTILSHPGSRLAAFRDVMDSHLWRRDLHNVISERARNAEDAMAHAAGVYFPNRVHQVRIALKKLRYSIEILQEIGGADYEDALATLKKGQDVLGDLHDRQALVDDLHRNSEPPDTDVEAQETVVRQVLEQEVTDLHRRYLGRREDLVAVCRAAQQPLLRGHLLTPPVLALGAAALSSGAIIARRFRQLPSHDH